MRKQVWISDTSNKRVKQIKQSFHSNLNQQSKQSRINYYDFLLVAKKLTFRFEQSSHLMALKNFFSKNKNSILIKKLVDALSISQESLNSKDDKIIVKFNVPDNQFAPIKQVTNEDEEDYYQDDEQNGGEAEFNKLGSGATLDHENSQEVNEKVAIILSIKLQEMHKKLRLLTDPFHYPNLLNVFDDWPEENIEYDKFKEGVLKVITNIRDKIRMSEDDIKTMFSLLGGEQNNTIKLEDIQKLKTLQELVEPMKEFYQSRINKNMVKNTLFKLGKVSNHNIQIYQLKNASVLEFQQIEDSIVNEPINRHFMKKRIPHFGPLKGAAKNKKNNNNHYSSANLKYTYSNNSLNTGKKGIQIDKERQKIQRILRTSKDTKHKSKTGDTVASKLRSLFIHKVILPREKMLEEEKEKYKKRQGNEYQLAIRPLKDTR